MLVKWQPGRQSAGVAEHYGGLCREIIKADRRTFLAMIYCRDLWNDRLARISDSIFACIRLQHIRDGDSPVSLLVILQYGNHHTGKSQS